MEKQRVDRMISIEKLKKKGFFLYNRENPLFLTFSVLNHTLLNTTLKNQAVSE